MRAVYAPGDPINMEYCVREGVAAEEILHMADELGADLVVMGMHGRTGLGRLLMGNTAESVLPEANCPVMVVKATPSEPSATSNPPASPRAVIVF